MLEKDMNIFGQDVLKRKNLNDSILLENAIKCTEPLYGKKAKCIIKIVPQDNKSKTLSIDKKCIKSKLGKTI